MEILVGQSVGKNAFINSMEERKDRIHWQMARSVHK